MNIKTNSYLDILARLSIDYKICAGGCGRAHSELTLREVLPTICRATSPSYQPQRMSGYLESYLNTYQHMNIAQLLVIHSKLVVYG